MALYVLLGIGLLVVLILSIPVEMAFNVDVREGGKSRTTVGWLLGLVRKDIGVEKEKPKKKERPKKKRRDFRPFLTLLRTQGLLSGIAKLVRRVLRRFRIGQLDAEIKIGLPDPADTAMLWALLWPVLGSVSPGENVKLRLEPFFEGPVFEIGLRGKISVMPIRLIGPVLLFLLSPAGFRVSRSMLVSGWKGRR